jgi:Right handed beta helix region
MTSERTRRELQRLFLTGLVAVGGVVMPLTSVAQPLIPVDPANGCGQTLSAPGEYVLGGDLTCAGAVSGLVITASNVVLHLAGHTIANDTCDLNVTFGGIVVSGSRVSGVQIDGGVVEGFNDGVILFASGSRVTAMTVRGACTFGIAVSGQNNRLENNLVTTNGLDGIGVGQSNGTFIAFNDISNNSRIGVDISNGATDTVVQDNVINGNGGAQGSGVAVFGGTGNVVRRNAVNGNANGIVIDAPGTLAVDNFVNGSRDTGIAVSAVGAPSVVKRNTVLGSGVDLSDGSGACDSNTWNRNTFLTDLVLGLSDGGPAAGCIR